MAFFQRAVFKPPRWLIFLSWIGIFLSAGTARFGAAGRTLILASSAAGSIAISLKNGRLVFVNITDQMGNTALKGFEQIIGTLKRRGVPEKTGERVIRSLGFETLKLETESKE